MNALIIACSDGDIAEPLAALQEAAGLLGTERLLVPGGPLLLTRPGMERRVALECIRGLVESKDIRTIYLVSHQACSAYDRLLGGMGFDQQELLERDLRRVRALLETTFAGAIVRCYVIPWRERAEAAGYGPAVLVE